MRGIKMKIKNLILFSLILIIFTSFAQAQYEIKKSVLSNAGTNSITSNYKLKGTLGEQFTQEMQSASNIIQPGFWYSVMKITDVVDEAELPEVFELYQNYPNPFNPTTTIKYDLPKEASVTLRVYNILGQEVETLVNSVRPAGKYEIQWNAFGLASGFYIYRIEASNFVAVKKLVLLK
jgi:hypothetical protein